MKPSRKLILGAQVYTPEQCLSEAAVLIEDGRITQVGTPVEATDWPPGQRIEADGLLLIPGLVDLQINGAFGMDFTAEPATIFPVAQRLPRYGVTRFLPTIVTSPLERIARAQAVLQSGPPEGFRGAIPIGLHVEGPFLNPGRKGAHRQEYLLPPSLEAYAKLSPESGVRLVTLAPELPGALEVITELSRRGIVVSAGHSLASLDQAREGFRAGIRYATHLFNAMSPLQQVDPGLPGAVLAEPGLCFGLIPDGIHVHPTLVDLVWRLSGAGRMTLVSDAIAALGMPPGRYWLGDLEVIVDETSARLPDGVLAGSILSHPAALRNLMAFTGCSLAEALTCLTTTPAKLLGMAGEIGQVAAGFRANLVLMKPDLEIVCTFVDGEIVFEAFSLV